MSISRVNWSTGLFRLWLSAGIIWWVAVTASVVAEASREALTEFWHSYGIECAQDSANGFFHFPSRCQPSGGDASVPNLSPLKFLGLTTEHLLASDRWTRWLYLAWVPLGVLVAAILAQRWVRWILFGFTPVAIGRGGQNHAVSDDRNQASLTIDGLSVEDVQQDNRTNRVGDRERDFRSNIVRATQALNGLDDELVELESQLGDSSKELAQELRQRIPGWGRKLIEFVQTLDKEGLTQESAPLLNNLTRIRPDAVLERAEADFGAERETKGGESGLNLASM